MPAGSASSCGEIVIEAEVAGSGKMPGRVSLHTIIGIPQAATTVQYLYVTWTKLLEFGEFGRIDQAGELRHLYVEDLVL